MDAHAVGPAASSAIEGLKKAQERAALAAQSIAAGSLDPQDVVSLSIAALEFKANVAVLKTDEEMIRSIIDVVA